MIFLRGVEHFDHIHNIPTKLSQYEVGRWQQELELFSLQSILSTNISCFLVLPIEILVHIHI